MSSSRQDQLVPKLGMFFTIIRMIGWILIAIGMLLIGTAVLGFVIMLAQIGPTWVGSMQYGSQKMAGFIFLLSIAYLLIFPAIGVVGIIIAGFGLIMHLIGTRSGMVSSRNEPDKSNKKHNDDRLMPR